MSMHFSMRMRVNMSMGVRMRMRIVFSDSTRQEFQQVTYTSTTSTAAAAAAALTSRQVLPPLLYHKGRALPCDNVYLHVYLYCRYTTPSFLLCVPCLLTVLTACPKRQASRQFWRPRLCAANAGKHSVIFSRVLLRVALTRAKKTNTKKTNTKKEKHLHSRCETERHTN